MPVHPFQDLVALITSPLADPFAAERAELRAEICRLRDEDATKQHRIDFMDTELQMARGKLRDVERDLAQEKARNATLKAKIHLLAPDEK